jgi:hypothetical protein
VRHDRFFCSDFARAWYQQKDQSSKWRQLANVPEEQFEAALREPEPPTTIGIIRAVNGSPRI